MDDVFQIESNAGFARRATADPLPRAVVARFGLSASAVEEIEKPGPTSRLYALATGDGPHILRSVAAEAEDATEAQCRILAGLDFARTIKPRPAAEGDGVYVLVEGGAAWMAYPEWTGTLFSGQLDELRATLLDAADFIGLLGAYGRRQPHLLGALPAAHCATADGAQLLAVLAAAGSEDRRIAEAAAFVAPRRDFFTGLFELSAGLESQFRPALVHNDLNHANILLCAPGPVYLDVEDVALADPRISLSHMMFKLIRHAVYSGHMALAGARTFVDQELGSVLQMADMDRAELHRFGAYRICADIALILRSALVEGHRDYLYDLLKRLHNAWELDLLLRPGPGD